MHYSIQQFQENGIKNIETLIQKFIQNPHKMAEFIGGIKDEVIRLGLDIIKETFDECDEMLRKSQRRKKDWHIVKSDEKALITSLGTVTFNKTLFKNKKTGIRKYLFDEIMGIDPHERITEDAQAQLLKEAVATSYKRGGEAVSLMDIVSKQTVMNKIHSLKIPFDINKDSQKKEVDYLYIDADEDHVATQGKGSADNKGSIAKLVYIYEGVKKEGKNRHSLINKYTFSGLYEGAKNKELWEGVNAYIEKHYETAAIKKIYVNADGGGWIKTAMNVIDNTEYVLDEFHMKKYLIKMTSHLLDSAVFEREKLEKIIRKGTKRDFEEETEYIVSHLTDSAVIEKVKAASKYFLSNWMSAKLRLKRKSHIKSCSAEGNVSHILSSRMSSRPMAWSLDGVDKMARLRAYQANKGDMLELVRLQAEELPTVVGGDEYISGADLLEWENKHKNKNGKYFDAIQGSLSVQIKKQAWFDSHLTGL